MQTNNQPQLLNRNRKSFAALLNENPNESLEIRNDNGKPFFLLGNEVGYVSPAAMEVLNDPSLSKKDKIAKLQYAESKKPGLPDFNNETGLSNWVPTLMVVGNRKPALMSFSAADLD